MQVLSLTTKELAHFIASLAGDKKLFHVQKNNAFVYKGIMSNRLSKIEIFLDKNVNIDDVFSVKTTDNSIHFMRKNENKWVRSLTRKEEVALNKGLKT